MVYFSKIISLDDTCMIVRDYEYFVKIKNQIYVIFLRNGR